jgi:hypothetical protein
MYPVYTAAPANTALLLSGPEFGSGLLAALAAASLKMPRSRTPFR